MATGAHFTAQDVIVESLSSPRFSKMDEFSDSPPKRTAAVPTQNDDITFVERMAPKSSFRRQDAVTGCPLLLLMSKIGIWTVPLIVNFSKSPQKSFTDWSVSFLFSLHHSDFGLRSPRKPIITSSYLCPTLNHHPWCPSTPGEHSFIFVGLRKDKDSYHSVAIQNLFIGLPKTDEQSEISISWKIQSNTCRPS